MPIMVPHFTKTLIVVRHCHRETNQGRMLDNGLSEKGLQQREELLRHLGKWVEMARPHLMSSPRLRCRETLKLFSETSRQKIQISELLEEQWEREKSSQFLHRVKEFLRWWKEESPSDLVVCSHGDWIPLFLKEAVGKTLALKKAGWVELKSNEPSTPVVTRTHRVMK